MAEWSRTHHAILFVYESMKTFLSTHFPTIQLAVDIEKLAAIQALKWSGSFADTHNAIAKLLPFVDHFNEAEAIEIITAGLGNSQINWISSDPDVKDLYRRVIEPRFAKLPENIKTAVAQAKLYQPPGSIQAAQVSIESAHDIPF